VYSAVAPPGRLHVFTAHSLAPFLRERGFAWERGSCCPGWAWSGLVVGLGPCNKKKIALCCVVELHWGVHTIHCLACYCCCCCCCCSSPAAVCAYGVRVWLWVWVCVCVWQWLCMCVQALSFVPFTYASSPPMLSSLTRSPPAPQATLI
jgi:hypothetical protein